MILSGIMLSERSTMQKSNVYLKKNLILEQTDDLILGLVG